MKVNEKAHVREDMGGKAWREDSWRNSPSTNKSYHGNREPKSPQNDKGIRVAGKLAGIIKHDTFCKRVDKSRHYFRKYEGYSISCEVLERLQSAGVKSILLTEFSSGETSQYQVSLATFIAAGALCGSVDDRQLCLAMKHWRPVDDRQQTLFGGDVH